MQIIWNLYSKTKTETRTFQSNINYLQDIFNTYQERVAHV